MLPAISASDVASIFEIVIRASPRTVLLVSREDGACLPWLSKACSVLEKKTTVHHITDKDCLLPRGHGTTEPQMTLSDHLDLLRKKCPPGSLLVFYHGTGHDRELLKQTLKFCQKNFNSRDCLAVHLDASDSFSLLTKHVQKRFAEWVLTKVGMVHLLERTPVKQWKSVDKSLSHVVDLLKKDAIQSAVEILSTTATANAPQGRHYLSSYCAFRDGDYTKALELLKNEIARFGSNAETLALGELLLEKLVASTDDAAFIAAVRRVFLASELSFEELRHLYSRAKLAIRLHAGSTFLVAGDSSATVAVFLADCLHATGLVETKVYDVDSGQSSNLTALPKNIRACRLEDAPKNISFLYCNELTEGYASKVLKTLGECLPDFNFIWLHGTAIKFAGIKPLARFRLNLGCGQRVNPEWLNLDVAPANHLVIKHDFIHEKLPFADQSCEAVYHSHVLEHLPKDAAPAFMDECYRVLCNGGILRVVVPDFEQAARLYLEKLGAALGGSPEAQDEYDWMMLEMVDQLTRHFPGGQMLRHWKKKPMPAKNFIIQRMGGEVRSALEDLEKNSELQHDKAPALIPSEVGAYRLGGEVHQWMYDRFSLSRLIKDAGFKHVTINSAGQSKIRDFAHSGFELDANGHVRKPESLFIEAQKI